MTASEQARADAVEKEPRSRPRRRDDPAPAARAQGREERLSQMTTRYVVQARITRLTEGWRQTTQLPTFLLDADIQGIVDEKHAEEIARSFIQSINPDVAISLSVVAEQAAA